MYAAYRGVDDRTLHPDDEEGVCTLYQQLCTCTSTSDCNAEQECFEGICRVPPCGSDLDCDPGLVCNPGGECVVPPCARDTDCPPGQACNGGTCGADPDCPICSECGSSADCGSRGVCIPAGFLSDRSACSRFCESSDDCPGNSACFVVPMDEGDVQLCFNADADQNGPCPSGFVCTIERASIDAGSAEDGGETIADASIEDGGLAEARDATTALDVEEKSCGCTGVLGGDRSSDGWPILCVLLLVARRRR
jgi:Cys-rich repeat protein